MKRKVPFSVATHALCVALLCILTLPIDAEGQGRSVRFEKLSLEEGLSEGVVNAIMQDSKGFMWFGTRDGLNKYDGYEFIVYRHDPDDPGSLSGSYVTSMQEDWAGMIWVGTYGAGLNRYDRTAGEFTRYRHDPEVANSLGGDTILSIFEDREGTLWIGTEASGLDRYDPGTDSFVHYRHDPNDPASLSANGVRAIYEGRAGRLWVGTDTGLDELDRTTGEFTRYQIKPSHADSLGGWAVTALCEDRYGALWIGTDAGLSVFDPGRGPSPRYQPDPDDPHRLPGVPDPGTEVLSRYQHDPDDPNSLLANSVVSIAEDRQGDIWVGMWGPDGGLDRFDRDTKTFDHYARIGSDAHSLSNNDVRSVFVDRVGLIWIGTYGGGLSKLNRATEAFVHYRHDPNDPDSLSHNAVFALCEDSEGLLWIGTRGGGLNSLDRATETFTHYLSDPDDPGSLASNAVYAIHEDGAGRLWIGTDAGLDRYRRDTGSFEHYAEGIFVRDILQDSTGMLWVGTSHEGLLGVALDTGDLLRFSHDPDDVDSLSDDTVLSIYEDRQGALWVGTEQGGLNRFNRETETFTAYTHDPNDPSSLSHCGVVAMTEAPRGGLWVATVAGLCMFDQPTGTFVRYTERDGLPSGWTHGLIADDSGSLWLSTNAGLTKLDPDPPSPTLRNFDAVDGLQSNAFNTGAYLKSKNGELLFGGVNGFNAFYPERIRTNTNAPSLVITAFKKLNRTICTDITEAEKIELSYRDNFISFEFAALDFTAPEKNQFAYKLEGFDQDWVFAGTRRYQSYTNLRGGDYVFRLRGSNNDRVWNAQGLAVHVKVKPPIWDTWWFRVIAALVVVGSVIGAVRLRVRGIEVRTRELETLVDERTYEIERRRQVAEGLREILVILNSDRSLEESLDYIVAQAALLTGAQEAIVFQREVGGRISIVASNSGGQATNLTEESPPAAATGVPMPTVQWIAQSMREGESLAVPDLESYRRGDQGLALPLSGEHGAVLGVPLSVGGEFYGGFALYYGQERSFSEEDVELALTFADQAALAIANDQLRDRAEEMAVADERNRLARDLHDAVTQTLFSASLIAEALPAIWEGDQDEGRDLLQELRRLSRGSLAEMRTLLLELRPTALVEASLGNLLRHLAEAATGRVGVPVTVVVDGAMTTLPPDVHVALYRIAQEALNNVVKHSSARTVEVSLHCTSPPTRTGEELVGRAELSVSDDGRGFDPRSVPPGHLGLGIIRERAEAIGAALKIQSEPGHGTRVVVEWEG